MVRVYWETIKKTALNVGIPAGIVGFSLLIWYLIFIDAIQVNSYSYSEVCAGTLNDPCIAIINFTAKKDIFIYPIGYDPFGRNTPFSVDKELKDWKIYRSWGKGWREIKLNETCKGTWCGGKPNIKNKYSFVFRKGKNYTIKIVAYKKNPKDTIKWGFGNLDPYWYGVPINSNELKKYPNLKFKPRFEWKIIKSTDIDYEIWIENKNKKNTEICLLNKKIKNPLLLPSVKKLYNKTGLITKLQLKQKNKKYGFCFNTQNQNYIKFGEYSTELSYELEGYEVYINDTNYFLGAYPHQKDEAGWIEFNLTNKNYSGNIDILFAFNTTKAKAIKLQLYSPHNKTYSYICDGDYYNYTSTHFWCYVQNNSELDLVFERDYDWRENNIFYWNLTEKWVEYPLIDSFTYTYKDVFKWQEFKNIWVEQNKEYHFRFYLYLDRIGFTPVPLQTKYWISFKPSKQNLSEAIDNNKLYSLDPWIDSSGNNVNKNYLDTDLIAYYKFNETSGTTAYDTLGQYNLTTRGGKIPDWTTGVIGGGYHMNQSGTDFALSIGNAFNDTIDWTWAGWLKDSSAGYNGYIGHADNGNGADYIVIQGNGDPSQIRLAVKTGGETETYSDWTTTTIESYTHVAIVYHNADDLFQIFMNGVNEINLTKQASNNLPTDLWIGSRGPNNYYSEWGYYDEWGFWKRALNSTEVLDLYNGGSGITYIQTPPNNPPSVTIESPLNQTYKTYSIDFNVTVNDTDSEDYVQACWFTIDNGITNYTMSNDTAIHWYYRNNSMINGSYTAKFYCNDTNGAVNDTESVDFTIAVPDVNYYIALPNNIIRFANCSPDWEFYPSYPQTQNSTYAAINATNNGTGTGDFDISLTSSPATGWTLFACNDTSTDPLNDNDCWTLSTTYQTIFTNVAVSETKKIWLYANCSYVSSNPQTSIKMRAV